MSDSRSRKAPSTDTLPKDLEYLKLAFVNEHFEALAREAARVATERRSGFTDARVVPSGARPAREVAGRTADGLSGSARAVCPGSPACVDGVEDVADVDLDDRLGRVDRTGGPAPGPGAHQIGVCEETRATGGVEGWFHLATDSTPVRFDKQPTSPDCPRW